MSTWHRDYCSSVFHSAAYEVCKCLKWLGTCSQGDVVTRVSWSQVSDGAVPKDREICGPL